MTGLAGKSWKRKRRSERENEYLCFVNSTVRSQYTRNYQMSLKPHCSCCRSPELVRACTKFVQSRSLSAVSSHKCMSPEAEEASAALIDDISTMSIFRCIALARNRLDIRNINVSPFAVPYARATHVPTSFLRRHATDNQAREQRAVRTV